MSIHWVSTWNESTNEKEKKKRNFESSRYTQYKVKNKWKGDCVRRCLPTKVNLQLCIGKIVCLIFVRVRLVSVLSFNKIYQDFQLVAHIKERGLLNTFHKWSRMKSLVVIVFIIIHSVPVLVVLWVRHAKDVLRIVVVVLNKNEEVELNREEKLMYNLIQWRNFSNTSFLIIFLIYIVWNNLLIATEEKGFDSKEQNSYSWFVQSLLKLL